jgi:photosystem II stability/assembly factor-like uncharacterized protein
VLPLFVVCDSWAGPMGTAFTYQGRLIDANNPADGLYDFQFMLYDANVAGAQKGSAVKVEEIDVIDGYFTVGLDFGGGVFDGNDRWLEIGIRTGELKDPNAYTILSPRQQVKGTPYALYAKTAGSGGGADSDWTISGNDMYSGVSGDVGIGTTSPVAKLDVSGDISTTSVYKIGGSTVLSIAGTENTFIGVYAGASNSGSYNTFLGYGAGYFNTTGVHNTFSGYKAGHFSTTGNFNTFSGYLTGHLNTTGSQNTFSGYQAGFSNTEGNFNTFSGFQAGYSNTTGSGNVFLGYQAGYNETGDNKLYIANSSSNPPLIYGDFSTGDVGIGTTSPAAKLEVAGQVKITDGSQGTGKVLTSNSEGLASWQILSVGSVPWTNLTGVPADFADNIDNVGLTVENDPTVPASIKDGISWSEVSAIPAGFADGVDNVGLTVETDPTVLASVKDGVSWGEVSGIPAGFADGVDDVGLTSETDPTVLASVKDGISWGEVSGRPAGLDDGDDVGITIESDPKVGSNTTNYVPKWNGLALVTGTIFDNGNVGIGTASPTAKLEVNGNIKTATICETEAFLNWIPLESNRSWESVAMSADGTKQTAVVDGGKIYISTDSGNTWTAKESNRNWRYIAMSADGTKQTAAVVAGQIYISTDSGNTWTPVESNRTWRSIAMSADGTRQTAVAYGGQIYVSTDSGNTWTPNESYRSWQSVAMSADGTKQTAVDNSGHIYISTDSGNTWTAKESVRGWYSVAMSADGTKQTAVVYGGQIYISTDSGNTWTAKESSRGWCSVAMSADGTKQTAVVNGGRIYSSTDSGNTWTAKESNRTWLSVAMSADGTKQTAVVYNGQIYVYNENISYIGVGIGTTTPAGKLDVNGSIYQRGYVLHADYVFEPGYKLESIEEHSAFMWQEKYLPAMPKIQKDENGQEMVEIGARSRGVVEELEKAHIYIEQLHKNINQLQEQNKKLQDRISAMETITNELAAGQKGGAR